MEDAAKYKVNVTTKDGELIIREGIAAPINSPIKLTINNASIEAPTEWCQRMYEQDQRPFSDFSGAICVVDTARNSITFYENAEDKLAPVIEGIIKPSADIAILGINTQAVVSPHKLSDVIRMNRTLFPDTASAMQLVSKLRDFKAKVEKESDAFKDDRANYSMKKSQVAKTNLPDNFVVSLAPFLGEAKQPFTVEVVITNDLDISLISPDLADYMKQFAEVRIEEQVTLINKATGCPVFYIQNQ